MVKIQPDRTGLADRTGRKRAIRRGAATVEFAVVAPLFLFILFAMVEFGRMVMVQQAITNAAREGARVGILSNATTAQVTAAVSNYLKSASISGTTTVSPDPPSSAASGSLITVTVSVPFTSVSWLPSPMFLGGKTLTASCCMRTEN